MPPADYFASVDTSLRGWRTRHVLALLYRQQGRRSEAEAQWWVERPDFGPAWQGRKELAAAPAGAAVAY